MTGFSAGQRVYWHGQDAAWTPHPGTVVKLTDAAKRHILMAHGASEAAATDMGAQFDVGTSHVAYRRGDRTWYFVRSHPDNLIYVLDESRLRPRA